MALPAGAIESGDDAAHEGELGAVRFVGELYRDATDVVDAEFRGRARV